MADLNLSDFKDPGSSVNLGPTPVATGLAPPPSANANPPSEALNLSHFGVKTDQPAQPAEEDFMTQAKGLVGRTVEGALSVVEPVTMPLRYLAKGAATLAGMEVQNKPLSLYSFLSAPDVTFTDVLAYEVNKHYGSDEDMITKAIASGMTTDDAAKMVGKKWGWVYGLGALADTVLDPTMYLGFGAATKASQKALEAGETLSKIERSTMSVVNPLSGKTLGLRFTEFTAPNIIPKSVAETVEAAKQRFLSPFDWRTGDIQIDSGMSQHAAASNNADRVRSMEFLDGWHKSGITDEERAVVINMTENTPNLRPELKMIEGDFKNNGVKQALTPKEQAVLGLEEPALRQNILADVERASKEEGVKLPPGRDQVLADAVFNIKRMNANKVLAQESAKALNVSEDLSKQLRPSYLAHVTSPEVRDVLKKKGGMAAYELELQGLELEAKEQIKSAKISTHDPFNKERSLDAGLRESNEILRNNPKYKTLLDEAKTNDFFVEDPYVASYLSMRTAERAAENKALLTELADKGFHFVEENILKQKEPRFIFDRDKFKSPAEVAFAENTVMKLDHYFAPKERNVSKYLSNYNRIFRTTALLKPAYYIQNWVDSVVKNVFAGVHPAAFVKTLKVLYGSSVKIAGKLTESSKIRTLLERDGVMKFGATSETILTAITMGKRMAAEGNLAKPGTFKKLLDGVRNVGAYGENWNRAALYIDRLDRGYSTRMALYDVENIHFNFQRTTPALDTLRLVSPFVQFPIKSLGIAKELYLARPGLLSMQAQFADRLDKMLNDPLESAALWKMLPEYARIQNPVYVGDAGKMFTKAANFIDDFLGANSHIGFALKAGLLYPDKSQSGFGQYGIFAKLPVGIDALNGFALWNSEVIKNGGILSGPLIDSFWILATGTNRFTGKPYDPTPGKADFENRLTGAMWEFGSGSVVFPQAANVLKNYFNTPDSKFMTPAAISLAKGAFGGSNGLVDIYNVDLLWFSKKMMLTKAIEGTLGNFNSILTSEMAKNQYNTSYLSQIPALTAKECFEAALKLKVDIQSSSGVANDYLSSIKTMIDPATRKPYANQQLAKITALVKGILKSNNELDKNYVIQKNAAVEARRLKSGGLTDAKLKSIFGLDSGTQQPPPMNPPQAPEPQEEAPEPVSDQEEPVDMGN